MRVSCGCGWNCLLCKCCCCSNPSQDNYLSLPHNCQSFLAKQGDCTAVQLFGLSGGSSWLFASTDNVWIFCFVLVCAFDAYHIEIDRPLLHLLVEQRTALTVVASEESAVLQTTVICSAMPTAVVSGKAAVQTAVMGPLKQLLVCCRWIQTAKWIPTRFPLMPSKDM